MSEALQAREIMLATGSGALVVLFGALYAMLFAFARLRHPLLMPFAYAAYLLFAASTLVLAHALHLSGFWLLIIGVMLVGYLLAPHGIWHLCVGTHEAGGQESEGGQP
ncbi:MAG: hypothetical protein KJO33_09695 [Gammaproteobacteria bacterium]|nr:hypothetical protein [Gammaproteobacteria bacterium]NNK33272.1 hypothetical protein [Xanthomonadales bacterium]